MVRELWLVEASADRCGVIADCGHVEKLLSRVFEQGIQPESVDEGDSGEGLDCCGHLLPFIFDTTVRGEERKTTPLGHTIYEKIPHRTKESM